MLDRRHLLSGGAAAIGAALSACSIDGPLVVAPEAGEPRRNFAGRTLKTPDYRAVYADYPGEPFAIRAFDYEQIDPRWLR